MRLSKEKGDYIKKFVRQKIPRADVYLFGSRTDDTRRGGDIDILVFGNRRLTLREKIYVKTSFQMRFGEQKLDVVSYAKNSRATFMQLARASAIKL
jgi:predicted nucleotidyltransferase